MENLQLVISGALESIEDYTDMFGYRVSFGPGDHKGVSESVLSVVENGRSHKYRCHKASALPPSILPARKYRRPTTTYRRAAPTGTV